MKSCKFFLAAVVVAKFFFLDRGSNKEFPFGTVVLNETKLSCFEIESRFFTALNSFLRFALPLVHFQVLSPIHASLKY